MEESLWLNDYRSGKGGQDVGQVVELGGFVDEVCGAEGLTDRPIMYTGLIGQHDHDYRRVFFPDMTQQVDAAPICEVNIENGNIGLFFGQEVDGVGIAA